MPDRKFDEKEDRQAVLDDFKKRIIDMLENTQELPEVGIYDEPVRYFKANLEWCKIIFGWLTWLQDVAGWVDAEDTDYPGIQAILIFEEGIEMATKEDIRDGMYEAFNRLAAQIVSGRYTNISVDEDGVVSTPSSGEDSAEIPEDDPSTPIDETESARYGAALVIELGLNQILADLQTYYGADATEDMPVADAQFLIASKYKVDEALMDIAVQAWWTRRAAASTMLVSVSTYQDLYCDGLNMQVAIKAVVALVGVVIGAKKAVIDVWNALTSEQFNDWIARGSEQPATQYQALACVPTPDDGRDITGLSTTALAYAGNFAIKVGHRYRFTVSGKATNPAVAGQYEDLLYHVSAAGVATLANGGASIWALGNFTNPTALQVPFQPSGIYSFTMDAVVAGIPTFTRKVAFNGAVGTIVQAWHDEGETGL